MSSQPSPASIPSEPADFYRQMVEAAGDVIFLTDVNGKITYINPAISQTFGYQQSDMIGHNFLEFVGEVWRSRIYEFYVQQFNSRNTRTKVEYPLMTRSGEERWVEQTVVLLTDEDKVTGFLGYLREIHDRKQAEEALERERNLLRTVIDLLPDYIFVKDTEGRFVTANRAMFAKGAVESVEAIKGMTDYDIFPPEYAEQYRHDELQILATGEPRINYEEMSVDAEGTQRWHLTSKVPLCDHHGMIIGLVGLARDITERKAYEAELQRARAELEQRVAERTEQLSRANEALETERNLLRTLIDHLPDYIYVKDTLCRFIVGNKAVADVMRTTPEALVGKTDFDFYAPELAEQYFADDLAVIQSGEALFNREEVNIDRVSEQLRWILTTKVPLRDSQGNIVGLVGIGRDITERKHSEDMVKKHQLFLRQILDTAPCFIWVKDADGRFTLSNKAHADALGATTDEVVGKKDEAFHKEQAHIDQYHRDDLEVLQTLQPKFIPEEVIIDLRTGQTRFVQTIKVPILADDGMSYQVLGVASDITERKHAEQQALQLAMERERVRVLADFIRDASHDFRTPLSTINTSVYLLGRTDDPQKQAGYRQVIQQQAAHLAKLVDGLMTMTRLDGEAAFQFQPVQVNDIVSAIIARGNPAANHKQINLCTELDTTIPLIEADSIELDRAISEVVKNAVQYTPDGGVITLRTAVEADNVVIEVHDTGIGIEADDLPKIFHRFYRVDKARPIETGGIGLGLCIAQKIVEQHGGTIQAESRVGVGSTFRFLLPLHGGA